MAIPTPNTVQTDRNHKYPLGAPKRAPTQAIPSQKAQELERGSTVLTTGSMRERVAQASILQDSRGRLST